MFISTNCPSGSWTAMSETPYIPSRFTVKAVMWFSGSATEPATVSNKVFTSGSYTSPKTVGAFLQLKDGNDIGFYSRRIGALNPTFVLDELTRPLTVTLPISYYHTADYCHRTSTDQITIIVFGEPAQ